MSAPRITAAARVQRLLALLQWAAGHPEGVAVDELCARFKLKQGDLARELELASLIGADSPHYDDMPFEVFVEDGLVFVRLFSFRRPMRLTPAEGMALVAAADVLIDRDLDGPDRGPLERAIEKLASLLGIEPGDVIDIDFDPGGGPEGALLREAIEADRQVSFTYWTYGRDEVAVRHVDPWEVFTEGGTWYLSAWAHDAKATRNFRLDRMADVAVTDLPRAPVPARRARGQLVADPAPLVVLDLAPSARWVAEAHPVVSAEPMGEDRLRVTLAVAGASWLERLLVALGPDATVVEISSELGDADIAAGAARRVLARYGRPSAAQAAR